MRIDALHLEAVGPFTDRRLDFSAGQQGVHVLHGPNEAGKSSALRALRALLFGFHPRSPDNFVHPYERLRVGATLRPRSGAAFSCVRRKGAKNTLLDATGSPMDEGALSRLLEGVDEKLFETLFGIDHAGLVRGGETLVKEHGREAEALFGSGLGGNAVHDVRKALEDEAASLFLPRGSSPTLNALLAELREVRRAQREASLAASRWDDLRREAERAREVLDALDEELAAARMRRTGLERLRRTLPGLARRAALLVSLSELGQAPELAADFGERRARAVELRRAAGERLAHAGAHLETLRAEIARHAPQQALLDEGKAIDALAEALTEQRRALADRPVLAAQRERIAGELGRLCERPGLSGAEPATLAARLLRKRRAEELGSRKTAREEALREARRQLAEGRDALAAALALRDALPAPLDTTALETAVRAARDAGDLDAAVAKQASSLAARGRDCDEALAALGRWRGSAPALLEAPLPDDAAMGVFVERFDKLAERERRVHEVLDEALAARTRAEEKLCVLAAGGEVPSAQALASARSRREEGWALLRARWEEGREVEAQARAFAGDADLAAAYESAVAAADVLADDLLRDAERVHARDALLAEREAAHAAAGRAEEEGRRLDGERATLEGEWRVLWEPCGIAPATPREMASWLARAERLRERLRDLQAGGADLASAEQAREAHLRRLAQAMPDAVPAHGSEMIPLRVRAEQRLEACREVERRRAALDAEVGTLEQALRALERRQDEERHTLDQWQQAWAALASELGVAPGVSPGELSDQFAAMQQVAALTSEDGKLARRIADMDGARRRFTSEVAAVCARVAPELADEVPEDAVAELRARLARQVDLAARLQTLREQAEGLRGDCDRARADLGAADAVIQELCREAGGAAPEALQAVEQRDARHRDARRELEEVERGLTADGDGLVLEALAGAARDVHGDQVRAELERLVERMEQELEPRRRELLERAVTAERAFAEVAGGEAAAEHAERAEQLAAAIRAGAERYVRVRVAAKVLRDQVEQFRARHRDPILAAASGYLATLTRGDHVAVATEFSAADEAVLCAVDSAGGRRQVDALSTGTRDQLYLALRLATLAHYLEHAEPLPFVVDDILVQFDDARAHSTLEALAEFSRRTQVLLFTHHEQVARDAEALAGAGGGVFVHRL